MRIALAVEDGQEGHPQQLEGKQRGAQPAAVGACAAAQGWLALQVADDMFIASKARGCTVSTRLGRAYAQPCRLSRRPSFHGWVTIMAPDGKPAQQPHPVNGHLAFGTRRRALADPAAEAAVLLAPARGVSNGCDGPLRLLVPAPARCGISTGNVHGPRRVCSLVFATSSRQRLHGLALQAGR